MTREEAMAWLRERFRPELIESDPEWVETMIELLMIRGRPGETSDGRALETVGGSA